MAGKIVGVFVDVNNLYYCVGKKFVNQKLDYGKYLASSASSDDAIYRAIAYGIQVETEAMKFISCLKHLGFEAKYKKPRVIKKEDASKQGIRRISWNVGIAMEVVRIVGNNKLDTVILGSSDPELAPLVEWVKERGVRCEILACGISKELKEVADSWTEITETLLEQKTENETTSPTE